MTVAANILLHMRRNLLDAMPPLPRRLARPVKQRDELQQIIDAKPRPSGGDPHKSILTSQTRPRSQHRAQSSLRVEEHHPVLTPVLLARGQQKPTSALGMERVRDREGYRRSIIQITGSCELDQSFDARLGHQPAGSFRAA